MPETRYFTLSHEPPNGGVPPGTMFAQATNPPNTPAEPAPDNGPPNGGAPPAVGSVGTPSPVYYPMPMMPAYPFWPAQYAMNFLQPPPQSVPCHGYSGPRFEPPGQYIDGHFLEGQGWSYIAPKEHTTINFVSNGLRPCDHGGGYYPFEFPFTKHKVPSDMTVRKLLERLGCPDGAQKGVTELILLGNDLFAAGDSFTQGGETSKRTLGEVGWGNESEVWLVVKRR